MGKSLKASAEVPSITRLFEFLETSFRTLETINDSHSSYQSTKSRNLYQTSNKKISKHNVHVTATNNDSNCPCCDKRYPLFKCFKFAAMSSKKIFEQKRICRNCLNINCFSFNCRLKLNCQICQQKYRYASAVRLKIFSNNRSL